MFDQRTAIGLDVHARSVRAAALDTSTGELIEAKLPPGSDAVALWVAGIAEQHGPVAAVYEAGPTGFGLARALTIAGVPVTVAAPSKIIRPAGDRVKTDARDAVLLARLLRMDELVAVRVPTMAEEAARDLVRARNDARLELMAARHRLSKLLLRHGIVYDGAYRPGKVMQTRWAAAPAEAAVRGDTGNRRLHHRWNVLTAHKKKHTVANTAIARELAGWCWSLAVMD